MKTSYISQNLRSRQLHQEENDDVINTSLIQSESSSKIPPPSQAFSSALHKLRFGATTGNVVDVGGSETPCCNGILINGKNYRHSSKQRNRNVHFDEATITPTAEFGETAARFRSLSQRQQRNKRRSSRTPSPPENHQQQANVCFGGCRNITVTYNDDDVIKSTTDELTKQFAAVATSLPSLPSSVVKKERSIFDACDNIFTYTGRFS